MLWGGGGEEIASIVADVNRWSSAMQTPNDLSQSRIVLKQRPISRIALAYEAGRDGFWLARWLIARGIEAHVIHSASVAVSRERKWAKTDRLDAAILMRVFLGWLRAERGHCGMVAIPTMEEEDARRPSRERGTVARFAITWRICPDWREDDGHADPKNSRFEQVQLHRLLRCQRFSF
jgi:hypothetical protein